MKLAQLAEKIGATLVGDNGDVEVEALRRSTKRDLTKSAS